MRKFVLEVLAVLIFIAITATGCSTNITSPSDASSSSSCCKLIQFLKENPVIKVQVKGVLEEVVINERKVILLIPDTSTEKSVKFRSLTIVMNKNAKIQKLTIDTTGHITEDNSTLAELQKTQKSSNRIINVMILLEPNGDHWEGIHLVFSQS